MLEPLMAMYDHMRASETTVYPPLPSSQDSDREWVVWVRRRLEHSHDAILAQFDLEDDMQCVEAVQTAKAVYSHGGLTPHEAAFKQKWEPALKVWHRPDHTISLTHVSISASSTSL